MAVSEPDQRLAAAIQATVVYADLFDFPLDPSEIQRDLVRVAATPYQTRQAIDGLVGTGALIVVERYPVLPGRGSLAELRRTRQARAARLWPPARRFGRLLGTLPFVRMVAISGSLAAGNPDARADLDYLIITAPGRLWLVRAMAIVLVRLARRVGHQLCPNYLLTTRALALEHHDLFTAHELLQSVPVAGVETYRQLLASNQWAARWLPNRFHRRLPADHEPPLLALPRRVGEVALGGALGDRLETWEGRRKQARFGGIAGTARFTADICEGHFGYNRRRVLREFQTRCEQLGIAPWIGATDARDPAATAGSPARRRVPIESTRLAASPAVSGADE